MHPEDKKFKKNMKYSWKKFSKSRQSIMYQETCLFSHVMKKSGSYNDCSLLTKAILALKALATN